MQTISSQRKKNLTWITNKCQEKRGSLEMFVFKIRSKKKYYVKYLVWDQHNDYKRCVFISTVGGFFFYCLQEPSLIKKNSLRCLLNIESSLENLTTLLAIKIVIQLQTYNKFIKLFIYIKELCDKFDVSL